VGTNPAGLLTGGTPSPFSMLGQGGIQGLGQFIHIQWEAQHRPTLRSRKIEEI
jgi:hypothetical protein